MSVVFTQILAHLRDEGLIDQDGKLTDKGTALLTEIRSTNVCETLNKQWLAIYAERTGA